MKIGRYKKNDRCRACDSTSLKMFLDLGLMPLINNMLNEEQLKDAENEPHYPLEVYLCTNCGLVQLIHVVPPEDMFSHYVYLTSTSSTMVAHLKGMTDDIYERFLKSKTEAMAVDIGSNDGTLLKGYLPHGVDVLGIDPAVNVAELANKSGVRTMVAFFGEQTAKDAAKAFGKADAITATNAFAHIDDWASVIRGVDALLKDDGVFVIEAPYLVDLIDHTEFDTIYHEHLSYVSLTPLTKLFPKFGMEVFDVKRLPIHGGSLRIFVCRKDAHKITKNVTAMLEDEEQRKLTELETYKQFAKRVEDLKTDFVKILQGFKKQGKRVAGYGAAAKGNVLLNYFKVGPETIDFIADKNPLKQNLYTPGMHIPVYAPSKIAEEEPDYLVVLVWNIAKEIMEEQRAYKENGGKFVVPIPKPTVV